MPGGGGGRKNPTRWGGTYKYSLYKGKPHLEEINFHPSKKMYAEDH